MAAFFVLSICPGEVNDLTMKTNTEGVGQSLLKRMKSFPWVLVWELLSMEYLRICDAQITNLNLIQASCDVVNLDLITR